MVGINQRLDDYIANYGNRDLLSYLERKIPNHAQEFISRLYADLDSILEELSNIADQLQGEDEAKLRSRVLLALKHSGYDADAEPHRRGHTDIVVKCKHLRLEWLAEAKRHSGYDHLIEGMKQLHDRYTNGRHSVMGLLVFVFEKKVKLIIEKWKQELIGNKLCGLIGQPIDDAINPFAFTSEHEHSVSGLKVQTRHIFTGLHFSPTDKSAVGSAQRSTVKASKKSQPKK